MAKHLPNIQSPKDFRKFNLTELKELAQEMREAILKQISSKGGHFASNLGTIELTIALHKVFNTPKDKLIWDVGHQAYPHKLITGRYQQFHTLKQPKGLSGFLKRSESEYDVFGAGHASTSLSAAMGFATATKYLNKKNKVVGIIGDGSLTGGMAYEALNNAGVSKANVIFVLNDNKMSIAPNVGAISKYLSNIITNPTYNKLKNEMWDFAEHLPKGKEIQSVFSKLDSSVKKALLPGGLFEDLGVRYFGPVDGHNLKKLIDTFEQLKDHQGPCLIHIQTQKGQGWKLAEKDSYKWHAATPFNTQTGEKTAQNIGVSFGKVLGNTLVELAKKDKRIIGITAAMPDGTCLDAMQKHYPKRVFDVGIAEAHGVTFAGGLACEGLKPVVAIYSTFLQRAFDQIVHDIALQKLNVIFAISHGGLVGLDGPTHHGALDISYLRIIPNLVVMAPSSEVELRSLFYTALMYDKGPVAIRYPKSNVPGSDLNSPFEDFKIGVPKIVEKTTTKKTKDILILAVGHMLSYAKQAVSELKKHKISYSIVDVRFIKPIDKIAYKKMLSSHQAVITLEDNVVKGGYGSSVLEFMAENQLSLPFVMLGLPDSFVTHGNISDLHLELGIDSKGLVKQALKIKKQLSK